MTLLREYNNTKKIQNMSNIGERSAVRNSPGDDCLAKKVMAITLITWSHSKRENFYSFLKKKPVYIDFVDCGEWMFSIIIDSAKPQYLKEYDGKFDECIS